MVEVAAMVLYLAMFLLIIFVKFLVIYFIFGSAYEQDTDIVGLFVIAIICNINAKISLPSLHLLLVYD